MSMDAALQALSASHFNRHRLEVSARTDRMFVWVMAFQYGLAIAYALATSPRTWEGGASSVHPHFWFALFLGGALALPPIVLARRAPGEASTGFVVALSQGLFSALLIHLSGGRIETHFHIFGSLALLAMYRDWRLVALNSAVVALDHALRGTLYPATLYGATHGVEWRFLEHAGWVLFEDAFLFVACFHAVREMRETADRQAALEVAQARIETSAAKIGHQATILNSVLTSVHDGLIVVGTSGEILHANPAVDGILGVRAHEEAMVDWSRRLGFVDYGCASRPSDALPLVRALHGESVYGEEYEVENDTTGEPVWLEIGAEPLKDECGERIGAVALFRDVTERRRILMETSAAREEAERANLAKGEFLSRTSHELRTPLNAILGFAQTLGMEDLEPEARGDVVEIAKAGRQLLGLIDEVLSLTATEDAKAVRREPRATMAYLSDVMTEVSGALRPLLDEHGIRLQVRHANDDVQIVADVEKLKKATLNLMTNAIKYNRPGGHVWVETKTDREGRLAISIADEGPGISQERLARLFTPFDRLGAEATGIQGKGLGLAVAQGLLRTMDGTIEVKSEVGKGTTFTILLPTAGAMAVAA